MPRSRKPLFSDAPSGEPKPIPVGELSLMIREALMQVFPDPITVVGEISNLSFRNHLYFSLKDEMGLISCTCWLPKARRLGFQPRDGQEVIATGKLDYWVKGGRLQFTVERMEPAGQGRLEAELRRRMTELRELGYFADERKRPLPMLPRRVAVVTSRTAAALQDVINTAHHRWPGCELLLVDVRVQGDTAAGEIADAIGRLSRLGKRRAIDVIILTRGGGSIEDLWPFNERIVADAVFNCSIPIVAAIGHETDTTIAELVADLRCSTPTQAAMRVVPDSRQLRQQLADLADRLSGTALRTILTAERHLSLLARQPIFSRPDRLIQQAQQPLDHLTQSLHRALQQSIRGQQQHLAFLSRRLKARDPRREIQTGRNRLTDLSGRLGRSVQRRLARWQGDFDRLGWAPAVVRLQQRLKTAIGQLQTLEPRLIRSTSSSLDRQQQLLTQVERQLNAIGPHAVLERGYSVTLDARTGRALRDADQLPDQTRLITVLAKGRLISDLVERQSDRPESSAATPPG